LNLRPLHFASALAVVFASTSMANISNATYHASDGTSGNTVISGFTAGTYTAPAGSGFCVGPPNACGSGGGVSGSYSFADISPTLSTITFTFFGSTAGAGPGNFFIDLSNFVLPDHDTITGVTYASGSLGGATSAVTFGGGTADFKFTTGSDYNAIGGNSVVFDVAETPGVPEPSSILLLGTVVGGLLFNVKKLCRA
jgi:hypothetical protein